MHGMCFCCRNLCRPAQESIPVVSHCIVRAGFELQIMLLSRLSSVCPSLASRLQDIARPSCTAFHLQQPRSNLIVTHAKADVSNEASAQPVAAPVKKYNLRMLTRDDVEFAFARSSGAGGQNVNKVNTKVDMRLDLDKHSWIPDEVKDEIRRAEKNRFTKEGVLVVQSQKHRVQAQNIDDALARLQEIIDAAVIAVTPKEIDPETIKRVKENIKAGQEKRLQNKKKDSMKKKERSRRDWD